MIVVVVLGVGEVGLVFIPVGMMGSELLCKFPLPPFARRAAAVVVVVAVVVEEEDGRVDERISALPSWR